MRFLIYILKVLAFVIMLPIVAVGGCLLWDNHKRSAYYAERPILAAMHGKGSSRDRRDIDTAASAAILGTLPTGTLKQDFEAALKAEGFGCSTPPWPSSVGLVCLIDEYPGAIYFLEAGWAVIAEFDDEDRLTHVRVQRGK